MATTLDGDQLKQIKVGGKSLSKQLTEAAISISLSASNNKVTELKATFQDDMARTLFVGERLRSGTSLSYGGWSCRIFKVGTGSNSVGATLQVTAKSLGVHKLEKQTGAKTWGTQAVDTWVKQQAKAVGLKTIVQPGLGKTAIVREKPDGDDKESTWDVITGLADEVGCWVFEYSNTLVFARPSWLLNRGGNRNFHLTISDWNNVTDSLAGVPVYTSEDGAKDSEKLVFDLVSQDADAVRPGDTVTVNGGAAGPSRGSWIITDVDFSFSRVSPVKVTCLRAVDPDKNPPKPAPTSKKTTGKKTRSGSRSGARTRAKNTSAKTSGNGGANAAAVQALKSFANRYNGARLDWDGGYGAQCVDLAKAWNESVVRGPKIRGNGKDWYRNCANSGAYISIGPGGKAKPGDIFTYGSSYGGGYGHVGVVVEDLGSKLRTFDQLNGRTGYHTLSKRGLIGFSRPKKWA